MINRLKTWFKRREIKNDFYEKSRLCKPCNEPCDDDLCQKIGCLNMDMRTNSLRLSQLVNRLESHGYKFPIPKEPKRESKIVNIADFRK